MQQTLGMHTHIHTDICIYNSALHKENSASFRWPAEHVQQHCRATPRCKSISQDQHYCSSTVLYQQRQEPYLSAGWSAMLQALKIARAQCFLTPC